jgi:signal transduction histidine kinase
MRIGAVTVVPFGESAVSAAALGRLAAALSERYDELYRHDYALVSLPPGAVFEGATAVAWTATQEDGGISLFGFATPTEAWGELFDRWFDNASLLPPAITGEVPNDSLLHVTVRGPYGEPVFETAMAFPATLSAYDTLDHEFGPFIVDAAVRQDAAARLIIGGLPQSKLPLILGLLFMTLLVNGAALLQLRRERQLAGLRDDFISGVSHELRTPLAQIRMFAELQESGKLRTDEDRARAVSVIHRESRRLTHLVDNILRFSRLRRAIATRFLRERINVPATVADLMEGFQPLANARGMTIEVDIDPGLAIVANSDGLNQMLLNLLDNAVKYGPRGQVIELHARREGDTAVFTVRDRGPGIPAADRRRIWDPYFRLGRDRDSTATGSGIGLAVVAQLAEMHGGTVAVDDAPGGGARFTLKLPAVPAEVPVRRTPEPQEVGA